MNKKTLLSFALSLRSLSLWLPCASGIVYTCTLGHARVKFLIQEIIELTWGGRALLLL